MSEKYDGGPAFPVEGIFTSDGAFRQGIQTGNCAGWASGLSIRDYFAAKAMQGALSGHHAHAGHEDYWPPVGVASYAYEMADAMLAERAK